MAPAVRVSVNASITIVSQFELSGDDRIDNVAAPVADALNVTRAVMEHPIAEERSTASDVTLLAAFIVELAKGVERVFVIVMMRPPPWLLQLHLPCPRCLSLQLSTTL